MMEKKTPIRSSVPFLWSPRAREVGKEMRERRKKPCVDAIPDKIPTPRNQDEEIKNRLTVTWCPDSWSSLELSPPSKKLVLHPLLRAPERRVKGKRLQAMNARQQAGEEIVMDQSLGFSLLISSPASCLGREITFGRMT